MQSPCKHPQRVHHAREAILFLSEGTKIYPRYHPTRNAGARIFPVQTVSNFSITSVSARPAFVHSWNAGKAIIVSM